MVEVETNEGRIAYGPVAAKDVPSLFDAGLVTGGAHGLRPGQTEELSLIHICCPGSNRPFAGMQPPPLQRRAAMPMLAPAATGAAADTTS